MNIQHLRTLLAVHDHASFSEAAEALFLTPAAVSQQMRNLEDELQVTLFDRTTRPPRLNAHGANLVEQARDVLEFYGEWYQDLSDELYVGPAMMTMPDGTGLVYSTYFGKQGFAINRQPENLRPHHADRFKGFCYHLR